ncbi:hypothetical protein Vadar_014291 [Vaccinium darrowii]|uniref:Uncharacterized protein n=1 Tax=Vaccinium darrowii TaxID=229202 RepID=A0ACB7YES4_9ERIC|nr:hypothetical protein Vadar_014291 [Vaccinium darrowii]
MESQSYSSSSTSNDPKQAPFRTSLHSVRKTPAKPCKKHVAPLPPSSPGIYKVEPKDFKDLVQKLTKGPDFQSHRLQRVAPPPLNLSTSAVSDSEKPATTLDLLPSPNPNTTPLGVVLSPLGFSPSQTWSSFLLMSPGTMSSLEQSKFL